MSRTPVVGMVLSGVAILGVTVLTLRAQSSPAVIRNPHNLSYGDLESHSGYEDADVPEDLGSRFDGDELSVGVALHEHGRIGCGYQPMLRKPRQKALHVSEHLLQVDNTLVLFDTDMEVPTATSVFRASRLLDSCASGFRYERTSACPSESHE